MLRNTQYLPREFVLAFNLLALFVITYILVDTFYGVINMRLNETGASKPAASVAADMPGQEALIPPGYEMIVQRNIFGATEKEETAIVEVEEKVEPVAMLQETSLALFLLGTITDDIDNSRAIIFDQRKRHQDIYSVGDSVQEALIRQILRGKVVLQHGDKDEVLSMADAEDIKSVAARKEQTGRPYTPARARPQVVSTGQMLRPYIPSRANYQTRVRNQTAAPPAAETAGTEMETVAENEEVAAAETEAVEESGQPAEQIAAASPGSPGHQIIPGEQKQAPSIPAPEIVARIQRPTGMTTAERPGFASIEPFVTSWIEAWENKNVDEYLSHYSKKFITPGGMSREAWEKQQYDRLESPAFINMVIRDMHKQKVNNSRVQAVFIQEYQSDIYSDKVLKVLELIWEDNGWKIAKETSMAAAQDTVPAATVTEVREAAPAPGFTGQTGVEPFIASWAGAWKKKSVEAYLSHYSRNFITPGGMSRAAWKKQREQRLARPQYIKIDIREMQQQIVDESRVQVAFIQEYRSDIYSDKVLKTLDLIRENSGWKIVKETSWTL
jgi:murein L,D-transpeptidase YafK/type II secretory pathway component PulC